MRLTANSPKVLNRLVPGCAALVLAVLLAGGATAQKGPQPAPAPVQPQAQKSQEYVPEEGQEGKDVIWLPTADAHVARMLDMAKVKASDHVIDLGSGDGRTVLAAARRGAKAHGIEYNPDMVTLSQRRAQQAGLAERATFEKADIFETDFTKATVLTLFLLPELNLKLRPKILDMKPGTRVVSNTFDMGEWKADKVSQSKAKCSQYCTGYLWIVPAKVAGNWTMGNGATLKLEQSFQFVTGTLTRKNGKSIPIKGGKLDGDRIRFTTGGRTYSGRVSADSIQGVAKRKGGGWKATRASS